MFRYAFNLVFRRKLRTFLTSLGITISVILLSLIIFGMNGLENALVSEFTSRFNPTQIAVSKSTGFFTTPEPEEGDRKDPATITGSVVDEIRAYEGVEAVEPIIVIQGLQAEIDGIDKKPFAPAFAGGVADPISTQFLLEVKTDKEELASDEILLEKKLIEYFGIAEDEVVGKTLIVKPDTSTAGFGGAASQFKDALDKEYRFEIVGIADSGTDRFDIVFNIPGSLALSSDFGGFESGEEFVELAGYTQLVVTAETEDDVENIKDFIVEEYALEAITSDDLVDFLGQITTILTIGLAFFAAISAVVASIGIVNTMVMSIYEQTREIGIIKAVGASNMQVLVIFLIQSGIIGLVGGAIGLLIVILVMLVANPFIVDALQSQGFTAESFFHFNSETFVVMGIIIISSIVVGILAGLYPAFRAAKLDPVKALRYE